MRVRSMTIFSFLLFVMIIMLFVREGKTIEKAEASIEIRLEVERNKGFLKVYTECYNFSYEKRKIKIIVKIEKTGKTGKSTMVQSKKIELKPQEKSKPMIAFLGVKKEDFYFIEVQVFDEEGKQIFYKTVTSEGNL